MVEVGIKTVSLGLKVPLGKIVIKLLWCSILKNKDPYLQLTYFPESQFRFKKISYSERRAVDY